MSRLNKELGLLQGIALLSTSLLGTGIFVVPALAATAAGSASLWAWLILIALVLPVAFTFAQLGQRDTERRQRLMHHGAQPLQHIGGLLLAARALAAAQQTGRQRLAVVDCRHLGPISPASGLIVAGGGRIPLIDAPLIA